jgi:hypothetical protein
MSSVVFNPLNFDIEKFYKQLKLGHEILPSAEIVSSK